MTPREAPGQLPIGQLMANLTRIMRAEMAAGSSGATAVEGIRPAHLQIFGAVKADGSRLTELAAAANLSLSATSELVDDLERLGHLERGPDPADGRAKLIRPTDRGWEAIGEGRALIAGVEVEWADRLGKKRYAEMKSSLQALLDSLEPEVSRGYRPGRE